MGLNLLDEIAEVLEEYEEEDDLPEEAPVRILLAETEDQIEEPVSQPQPSESSKPLWALTIIFIIGLAFGIYINIFDSQAFIQK